MYIFIIQVWRYRDGKYYYAFKVNSKLYFDDDEALVSNF